MSYLPRAWLSRVLTVWALLAGASCSDILGFERGHLAPDAETTGSGGGAPDGASVGGRGGGDGSIPPGDGSGGATDASPDVATDDNDASRLDVSVDDGPHIDASVDAADTTRLDVTPEGPDGGPDVAARCNAMTCPTGCCDANDTCVPTPTQGACGAAGSRCVACVPGQECGQGKCVCNPSSCPSGCCDASGACIPLGSQTVNACGTGGNACSTCAAGQACTSGACSCGGITCAGCCSNGQCVGSTDNTCGAGGGLCTQCRDDQDCNAQGKCVCTAASCPNGCCDANQICNTSGDATCGVGGAPCQRCEAGRACSAGQCICNPASCPTGCCNGNTCVPYATQSDTQCGTGGIACGACASGRTCSRSGSACVTWCGRQTLPTGVAAADYQCVDFEDGLPSPTTWAQTIVATGTLALTAARAVTPPNGLQTVAPAPSGPDETPREAYLQWTAPGTTVTVKNISVAAAISPVTPGFSTAWTDQVDLLCAGFPSNIESEACLAYTNAANKPWNGSYTGLFVYYQYFQSDQAYFGECAVSGAFVTNMWTNAELRVNATTGLVEAVIDGVVSSCTTAVVPTADTLGFVRVGSQSGTYVPNPWSAYFDNVVAFVRR